MVLTILLSVAALVAIVLALAASKPDHFRVERSTVIGAPPDRVFALLNNFQAWRRWSPWEGRDPDMQRTQSGPAEGVGAVYGWEGNKEVGKGRMEIRAATPPSRLEIQLDFLAPFEAHNTTEFTLQPDGTGTRVTWAMFGPSPFMSKLMMVFMSMDKMVGKDFEQGLANLTREATSGQ